MGILADAFAGLLANVMPLLAQRNNNADADPMAAFAGMMTTIIIINLVSFVFFAIVHWKIFEKAGQPGWAALVPFYQTYVLIVEVCKMPPIWFWLLLVPCANFVVAVILIFMIPFKLAEKFGKETGFAVGLLLLGIVFYPILAFGDAQYVDRGRGRKRYADDYDDEDDDDDRPRKKKQDNNW